MTQALLELYSFVTLLFSVQLDFYIVGETAIMMS